MTDVVNPNHHSAGPRVFDDDNTGRCTAMASRTGERCLGRAIKGSHVCYTHGGRFPHVRAKANKRLAIKAFVEHFEERLGGSGPIDVVAELESEIRHVKAQVLAMTELVYGEGANSDGWTQDQRGNVAMRVESAEGQVLHKKQELLHKLLNQAIKLGLEERRVQLQERDTDMLEAAVARTLAEAGIDDTIQVRLSMRRHLQDVQREQRAKFGGIEIDAADPLENFD